MAVVITGNNTPTAGGVTYGDGTTYANTAAGSSGQFLQSNGASAPSWVASPATSPAGSTGQVQYNNAGAFGAISSGTSGQVLTSAGSGAAPTWASGGQAKVWAYVTMSAGTPTLQNSLNVSSISDLGVGQFDVNTTTRNSQYYASVASLWGGTLMQSARPSFSGATGGISVYFYNTASATVDPTFSWSVISAGAL